jgi:putative transposase
MTILFMRSRNRTPSQIIGYGLYLYFLGLSFRNAAKALSFLKIIKISHVAIWKWIQKYKPKRYRNKKKILEFIIDEIAIKVGSELIWLWIVIEPTYKEILSFQISKERNMFVAERILSQVVNKYGLHSVSTDGGTWYPQACKFLKLVHHLHSSYEKSLIERTMQYIKDRIESFDDYFPCKKNKCKLNHVKQWLGLFVDQHNKKIIS